MSNILQHWRVMAYRQWYKSFKKFVKKELGTKVSLPLSVRIKCLIKGFHSYSYSIYKLDKNGINDYLTDYQRTVKASNLDGFFSIILRNKLLFTQAMGQFSENIPATLGLIFNGKVQWLHSSEIQGEDEIENYCMNYPGLVFKPISGSGGEGIYILNCVDGIFYLNGTRSNLSDIKKVISKMNAYLVTEFIRQAEYSEKISPETSNTIRILMMWDHETNKPFIATAVHRFGIAASAPADNFSSGGISSLVDLETGVLGIGGRYYADDKIEWDDFHPETKVKITDTKIPNWSAIKERLILIMSDFPYLPYCGLDVIIDHNLNPQIIEGNDRPAIGSLQIHKPLLIDKRVARFYRHHCVID